MFIDEAEVVFSGGHGGPGKVSFGKKMGSGPDGGNGGQGGDMYVEASTDLTLLNQFSHKQNFSAQDGEPGSQNKRSGKDGKDLIVSLPVGATLIDETTGEEIAELTDRKQQVLIAKGGKGGRGNYEFRSPRRTTPEFAQPGLPGEEKKLKIILKLIADFGLIGLPNAGKSSLLNELTNAQAKTANYAFTTLSPNLGVYSGKILADIPGLIEGASEGRGLGISFLKHIEKVGTLLHCISVESTNPLKDYKTIRSEMGTYNKSLLEKRELILLTKTDLTDDKTVKKLIAKLLKIKKNVIPVSIHDWESLEKLKYIIEKSK